MLQSAGNELVRKAVHCNTSPGAFGEGEEEEVEEEEDEEGEEEEEEEEREEEEAEGDTTHTVLSAAERQSEEAISGKEDGQRGKEDVFSFKHKWREAVEDAHIASSLSAGSLNKKSSPTPLG